MELISGDLENRIYELQLQLREGRLGETVQHVEACLFLGPFFVGNAGKNGPKSQEKRKIEEGMKEEVERMRPELEL